MIYDLTITLDENTLPFPSGHDPHMRWEHLVDHCSHKSQVSLFSMSTHLGTHIDVPLHFIEGGKNTAEIDLSKFCGEAVCLAAANMNEEEIFDITDTLEKNRDLIKPGDIILLFTGWEDRVGTPEYFKYPEFRPDTGEILKKYALSGIGFDLPSIDRSGRAHISVLSRDMSIIESLVNLRPLVGKRFFFSAVPLKFADGDGSPVRAYAIM